MSHDWFNVVTTSHFIRQAREWSKQKGLEEINLLCRGHPDRYIRENINLVVASIDELDFNWYPKVICYENLKQAHSLGILNHQEKPIVQIEPETFQILWMKSYSV